MRRISETVQLEAFVAGATDSHGNELEEWAAPVEVGVYAFNPGGTSEPMLPGHDRVVSTPTVYVPRGTVFQPRDRVTVRGVLFEVDGVTRDFDNPFNPVMDGNSINLRRVGG